jgi:maltooligosyltrehalose trehalohydrolase
VVELTVGTSGADSSLRRLTPCPGGYFEATFADVTAGDRYRYVLDGTGPFPDPVSRCQPDGVHGASMVVDPSAFRWSDQAWTGRVLDDLVIYELHVGTFTAPGTFRGVEDRLPSLVDLGVTAIELMPVADFPGARNWGYDGVALFAPARCYGPPDDLRRLVDAAHRAGLAVLLDVVYNHVGPDGAYLYAFSPYYFTDRRPSPWGAGVNVDGDHANEVRAFLIENALHWVHEYHVDGLRLDATHAIVDENPRHVLAELSSRVRDTTPDRDVVLIAEDHRNLRRMVEPESAGGWGLDGVWADDFHHQVRRMVAGDRDGYYQDFSGTMKDLAATIRQGWFFTGQHSTYLDEPRGTDPTGIPLERAVVCLQNHDQIGNRAFGERLHHQIDLAAYRAVAVLLLTVPETPLLFMGQEWAASTPFLYFTDHNAELGRLVTEGRRREFGRFQAFTDPAVRERIPDPQASQTFEASRLKWDERQQGPHDAIERLYQALLALRREEPALHAGDRSRLEVSALDEGTIAMRRSSEHRSVLAVVRLTGAGTVDLATAPGVTSREAPGWVALLHTEEERFAAEPHPPVILDSGPTPVIQFMRPSAVILTAQR